MELERIFDYYIKFNKQEGNEVGIKVLRSHKALLTSLIEEGIIKQPSLKPTSLETKVGSVVKQLRLEQGKSLRQISLEAGVSQNHLWRIEQFLSSPTERVIKKLAAAFDIPISFLFGETPSINNK